MKSKRNSNMAGYVAALLLLFSIPLFSRADDYPSLFKQGNEAYGKARYQQAISLYEQILKGGRHSEEIYFNLGNAYFKLGDIPSALLNYEKAHKLAPGDEDVNFNIYFANSKTSDKVEPAPEFFATRWWHNIILHYSIHTLAVLSILLLIGGSGILVLYLFANVVLLKKAAFYLGTLVLFWGLLTAFVANRQAHYFNDYQQAIIFSGSINVRSAPIDQAVTLFVLHEGTKVNILDNNSGWLKIQLANGTEGWIHETDIKGI
jgi:tetratricopeptide (TPR) repeat protein